MSDISQSIVFFLLSLEDFEDQYLAQKVIDIFVSAPDALCPQTYNLLRGKRKIKFKEELVNAFVGSETNYPCPEIAKSVTLLLDREERCDYQVSWNKYARLTEPSFQMISGGVDIPLLQEIPELLEEFCTLAKEISAASKCVYGHIQSAAFRGWSTPVDLSVRLPDIRPMSIYGYPYIELFGRKAIESAPFLKIEKISPDSYWLEANKSVFEQVDEERKKSIREHFGENAFMVGKKWRYSSGRSPVFDFSKILLKST